MMVRAAFDYGRPINWYPGHMARAVKALRERLGRVDIVVEVRDARVPLSSVNPTFDRLLGARDRVLLFNKADLANSNMQATIETVMRQRGVHGPVLFTSALSATCAQKVLRTVADLARAQAKARPSAFESELTLAVMGVPNVGKSSLINILRNLGTGKGVSFVTLCFSRLCFSLLLSPRAAQN